MPRIRKEPGWLNAEIVGAIHDDQLLQHGGMPGVRDAGLLESALGRPRFRWSYRKARDLNDCAAAYGFGIARNHPFNDGNKRTAFQAMYTFLAINGIELNAPEVEAVSTTLGVADGSIAEGELAGWLRANGVKPKPAARRRKSKRT
jgi:death-on-curing protein